MCIVYAAKVNDQIVYIGSGKEGREKHCNSGKSSSVELNRLFFSGSEIIVNILHKNITKQTAEEIEKKLIKKHLPKCNILHKQSSIKVLSNTTNDSFGVKIYPSTPLKSKLSNKSVRQYLNIMANYSDVTPQGVAQLLALNKILCLKTGEELILNDFWLAPRNSWDSYSLYFKGSPKNWTGAATLASLRSCFLKRNKTTANFILSQNSLKIITDHFKIISDDGFNVIIKKIKELKFKKAEINSQVIFRYYNFLISKDKVTRHLSSPTIAKRLLRLDFGSLPIENSYLNPVD